jgi:hypothetical protein
MIDKVKSCTEVNQHSSHNLLIVNFFQPIIICVSAINLPYENAESQLLMCLLRTLAYSCFNYNLLSL